MKKAALIFVLLLFSVLNSFPQDLQKKAETNPLDCFFYLLSKDDNRSDVDIYQLTDVYFQLGRYDEVSKVINLLKASNRVEYFTIYSNKLLVSGKRNEASLFLSEAIKNFDKADSPSERILPQFIENLIKLNKVQDAANIANEFADEYDDENIFLLIAEKLVSNGEIDKANQIIEHYSFPTSSKDNLIRARVGLLYAKLKQTEKAALIVSNLRQNAFVGETDLKTENIRRKLLFPLIKIYLELGETEKSFELWNQYGNQEDFYEYSQFTKDLLSHGQKEKVSTLLFQMQSDKKQMQRCGTEIVKTYLSLEQIDNAFYAAKNMSDDFDNFCQQDSFMILADKFIAENKINSALEVLDFAFERARKIVYKHEAMNSVGASSGSRKEIYLGQIYSRLMKLKKFDKAFTVFSSIDSENSHAKEFYAEHLIDFVKQQVKTLPRKKIYEFLTKAQDTVKEDEEYYPIKINLLSAEIFAQIGEKAKAVKMITKGLEVAKESCCYEKTFLVFAGKVFEENKLTADANLKKILREYISDTGN